MPTEDVRTVFVVEDQGSGPLNVIARASEKLEKSAGKAKTALGGVGAIPAEHSREETEEKIKGIRQEREQFKVAKEELSLRKARMREAKLEMAGEQIAHRAASTAMLFMSEEGHSFGGEIIKTSMKAQAVGLQMVGLGGHMGAAGKSILGLAGKATIAGAIFEVASGVAASLNEALGNTKIANELMANAGKAVHQALDDAAETYFGVASDKSIEQANDKYAMALGFRNAKEYEAVETLSKSMAEERKRAKAIDDEIGRLDGMPTDKTGDAMREYQEQLIKSARLLARPGEDVKDVVKQLESATEKSIKSLTERADHEAELAEAEKNEAKLIRSLPHNASLEQIKEHNAEMAKHVQSIIALTGARNVEAETILQGLDKRVELGGSAESVIESMQQEEQATNFITANIKQNAHILKKLPLHPTLKDVEEFNSALNVASLGMYNMAKAAGIEMSPEKIRDIRAELKSAVMNKHRSVYDFRNSRFDIKQQFAEGFDPDRIATAFTNDLAALGEQRLQSPFSAPFGQR